MKILITTTLNRNLTEAKLKPLILLPEVERIFMVSDTKGPELGRVQYITPPAFLMKLFRKSSIFRWLYKFYLVMLFVFLKRPDLIMAYSFVPHGLNAFLAGKVSRKPVCINIIGGSSEIEGGGYSCDNSLLSRLKKANLILETFFIKILKKCNFITVTGNKTKQFLLKKGLKEDRIFIIPSSVDTERFSPDRKEFSYDILTIGELIYRKRIDKFLKVVKVLREDYGYRNLKAAILGRGSLESLLKKKAMALGIEKNVDFLGFNSNVEDFLNCSRAFVLTSKHEGLALSAIEAMACGTVPVIAGVGDLKDLAIDGFNSRVIDTGEEEDFARAIDLVLKNESLWEIYSRNAYRTVIEGFTNETMADRWREILYRVIEDRQDNIKKSLRWYKDRLLAMDFYEVVYRFFRMVKNIVKNYFLTQILADQTQIYADTASNSTLGKFFISSEDMDDILSLYKANFIKEKERILKFAERIISEGEIGWHRNRQQYLFTLAKVYLITKDSIFAKKICRDILDWIEQNPPYKGEDWKSPLETAIRLISWVWAYSLTKEAGLLEGRFYKIFLNSIFMQTKFIYQNLSFFSSSANNHLIGEASALFIIGVLFPEFKDSKRWREKGIKILAEEIERQTFEDGGTKEQAIHYQGFVMDFYLQTILLAKKNNIELPEIIYKRFEQMVNFLINLMDSKGNAPFIGDSDDGFAIRFSEDINFNNLRSLVVSAAVLFNKKGFKFDGWGFDEKNLWLFGKKGLERFNQLETLTFKLPSKALTESGYYIMRSNGYSGTEEVMIFDCSGLGYLSIAAHGHADCLSLTLSIDGKEFLVDPGTYLYHLGGIWRDYFKGTASHNTIRIDGKDQSESLGPFLWGRKARPFLGCWESKEGYDYVEGLHTGYLKLRDPVLHKRQVNYNKRESTWKIYDNIYAKKEHLTEIFFHFSSECKVNMVQKNILNIENMGICISMVLDTKLQWNLESGSVYPIAGWQSRRFGKKIKSTTLIGRNRFLGNAVFNTAIKVV